MGFNFLAIFIERKLSVGYNPLSDVYLIRLWDKPGMEFVLLSVRYRSWTCCFGVSPLWNAEMGAARIGGELFAWHKNFAAI